MAFDSFIKAATTYSQYLDMQVLEIQFRSSVKDKFMNCYLASTAKKTAEQISVLNKQIETEAPKAAKKVADWTSKKSSTDQQLEIADEDVLKSAKEFHDGCKEMRANTRYVEYRAARKELKNAVTALGKQGITKEAISDHLDKAGLSSVKFRAEQLFKYSQR